MTTSEKTTISIEDIHREIAAQQHEAYTKPYGWHFVRVWPDGSITRGIEPSRCVPESEYYRTGSPHPVAVWSTTANYSPSPDDGVFAWIECEPEEADFYATPAMDSYRLEADERHTVPCRLDEDDLIEPIDAEALRPAAEIRAELEAAGYKVED